MERNNELDIIESEGCFDGGIERLGQSVPELAKNTTASFNLDGWPAACAIMSFPLAVVACYAIKTLGGK